jgi:DNA-binding CsgD family transcriptional regulator
LLALASTAALQCGDMDDAHGWADEAESVAERLGLPLQRQHVRRARAELHAAKGEHDAAARMFHGSADAFRRAGLPIEHAWTLVVGARSAQAALGADQALEWLDTAARTARGCGAQRILEEVARTRTQLPVPYQRTAPSAVVPDIGAVTGADAAVALLTKREREIAELAATGKSTKEIAEQLFVSSRTVESHLNSIFRKLNIRSRAGLLHALSRGAHRPARLGGEP